MPGLFWIKAAGLAGCCLLAGCASEAGASKPVEPAAKPAAKRCYQADWQAETVPVIHKRLGPEGLAKYDDEQPGPVPGCP